MNQLFNRAFSARPGLTITMEWRDWSPRQSSDPPDHSSLFFIYGQHLAPYQLRDLFILLLILVFSIFPITKIDFFGSLLF